MSLDGKMWVAISFSHLLTSNKFDWEYLSSSRFSFYGNGFSTVENEGIHRSRHLVDRFNMYDDVKEKSGVPIVHINHDKLFGEE